jgi:MFS family permease
VFGIDALTSAAAGVLVFARVRATKPAIVAKEHHAEGLGTVLRDRTFLVFVLLGTGFWTVISCVGLMPITMLHRGLPPAAFGSVLAVNGVIIVAGQLFVPRLLQNRSRTSALALASTLVAIGVGAVAVAPSVLALAITVTIWTFGEMLSVPGSSSLTAELSPAHLRGRYQGIASMTFTFSGFVAPVIGGLVIDHAGDAAIWVGCFVLGALVAIGHVITGPARERRAAQVRALEVERPREPVLV